MVDSGPLPMIELVGCMGRTPPITAVHTLAPNHDPVRDGSVCARNILASYLHRERRWRRFIHLLNPQSGQLKTHTLTHTHTHTHTHIYTHTVRGKAGST